MHDSPSQPPDFSLFPDPPGGGASAHEGSGVRLDTPDKGTPLSRLIALIVAVLAIAGVMTVQQIGALTEEPVDESKVVAPEPGDQYLLSSGIMVKLMHVMREMGGVPPGQAGMLVESIEDGAIAPVDKFRALVVSAEVAGPEPVLKKVDAAAETVEYPGSNEDFATLRTILEGRSEDLSDTERTALTDRHGYYGRLALSQGLPDTDPSRARFFKGSGALLVFLFVLMFGILLTFAAAVTCFILMVVRIANGKVRPAFLPPMPGGSVYLEMVAVMAASFLLLQVAGSFVVGLVFKDNAERGMVASLAMQWLLLPVIFWPVLRGVPWKEHARRIGFTRGKGLAREAGVGVVAYFAALPIFVAVVAIMVALIFLYEMMTSNGEPHPPQMKNEVLEILSRGNPLTLAMFFLLATVWAPIVEEAVFRGGLFRHVRGSTWAWRTGSVVVSALVSALAFSVMHGYAFFMLAPVFTLGVIFALMREWRSSLVACITAHALHNGTLLAMAITLLTLAKAE